MADFDLVIRNAEIHDGLGSPAFTGDVAVRDGRIVAVGAVSSSGREEIDAAGRMLTPGFVDIHTHYDGQVIWEDCLKPSSHHGVTTVVIGNCGVGFAPCRAEDRERLVKLMEGVEDIPGVVLTEGLSWDWESYPEYLDAVEQRPHDINIASYLPHSALRVYVMGQRAAAGEAANAEDLAKMADLTREAMAAGAIGLGSSRTLFHRSSEGQVVPTVDAGEEELATIARAMGEAGHGLLQIAADYKSQTDVEGEFGVMARAAAAGGRPLSLPLTQGHERPEVCDQILDLMAQANQDGAQISGQSIPRGIGMLFGLELSLNPFCLTPAYQEIADLPLPERLERMRDSALRRRILEQPPGDPTVPLAGAIRRFDRMFEAGETVDYEPPMDSAISARAQRAGVDPLELVYDILTAGDGKRLLYLPFANYAFGNLDKTYELLSRDDVVLGLGDGGAHCGIICDAAFPTFVLTYWARDRVRGKRFTLPQAIKALTSDTARTVGLLDRGVIAPGYNADLNIIDFGRLHLYGPEISRDLPAGGRRLIQRADGYVATIVNGEIVYQDGKDSGRRPGRLLRGPQAVPVAA